MERFLIVIGVGFALGAMLGFGLSLFTDSVSAVALTITVGSLSGIAALMLSLRGA